KQVFNLGGSDIVRGIVQVVEPGKGENELHFHTGVDTFWMVLSGRVRFHGPGDAVYAELGRHEGMITPRGLLYWFENCGDEALELLQIAARDRTQRAQRIVYGQEPPKTPDSLFPDRETSSRHRE